MKKLLIILLSLCCTLSHASQLAITFDDLPSQQNEPAAEQVEINQKILNALIKFKAPAIGFVNEEKLYSKNETKEKTSILQLWIDNGFTLGNHTYSHVSLHKTPLEEFKNNVNKGEQIFKYHYFRHPYLHTGTTPQIRTAFEQFLKKEGYIVAPVTIDTDDWKFDQQLIENPKDKEKIIQKYLEHTKAKFAFYEAASKKIFGYNIKHIWLLHVNLLNSYAMEDLLKIARERGYDFETLDSVLEDKVYAEPNNYYEPFGVSWLYRWDFTRGKVVDWSRDPEPYNNPFIRKESLTLFDKARNRSIPVEFYVSEESDGKAKAGIIKLPVVIINHGHSVKNTEYSFIANSLAAQGYFVLSIQHDLESDLALPTTGNLFERRKPLWKRGTQNILFVISEFKRIDPNLDLTKVTLIGHSNGGDISMLFASLHPEMVSKVISLDSLRYPFPTDDHIPILALMANDTKADNGVLPKTGVIIISLKNAKHIDMCDRGPEKVKEDIVDHVSKFLIN